MKTSYYITAVSMALAFIGCAKTPQSQTIEDLEKFPQTAQAYIANAQEHTILLPSQQDYEEKYFSPWNYTKPPFEREEILWTFRSYTFGKSYGENLQLLDEEWFNEMRVLGNYEEYGTLNKKAISLSYLNLRNFPTHKPVLRDPEKAGEGFPFDYMQNSGVHANEPLFISHLSLNGEWAYIFTAYATGWVPLADIAFINDKVAQDWQNALHIELLEERYPIKDSEGNFVFQSRVGMRLPLISIESEHYVALTITAGKNHSATYTKVNIPMGIASERKILINPENLKKITDLMLRSNYGWGGLYEERDCSSMLRDLYAPFGIWLPRNSSEQSKVGKVISFEDASIEEKKRIIIQEGIPFETLLYKQGHILLYLGQYQGEITVLHNVWGIKTLNKDGTEGRKVIGKTVISSLELGKEREEYDPEKGILSQMKSMNIITQ